jgi:hypothetical protein
MAMGVTVDQALHDSIVDEIFSLASKASDRNSWAEFKNVPSARESLGLDLDNSVYNEGPLLE